MKRIFFALLFTVLLVPSLSAQYFGLRAGINSTNASIDFDNDNIETEGDINLMLGVFFDIPIATDLISLQPEVNYLNRGYSSEVTVGNLASFEQNLVYLDLGALVKLNFGRREGTGFYVGAGPYLSYALSGTVTELGEERDIDFDADRINRGELQVAGVAGFTFDLGVMVFLEGRYHASLSNQSDQENLEITQNSIGINGGIMIPFGN